MKSEASEYMVEKELGDTVRVDGFRTMGQDYPLRKAMVDHDH